MSYPLHLCWLMLVAGLLLVTREGLCEVLVSPMDIYPKGDQTEVDLHVRMRRQSIPLERTAGGEQRFFRYTARLYEYKDYGSMLTGPTLHVVPGGELRLRLYNELGAENDQGGHPAHNQFHSPNTTNVHFHGMHSDPHVDNPFVLASPGENIFYKLSIPRDHRPGLHWYHSHSHGSVHYQLMGGLFGAMIVEGGPFTGGSKDIFRYWDSQVLLIHVYRFGSSGLCAGTTLSGVETAIGSNVPSRPEIVDEGGTSYQLPSDLFLVNGQHRPTVNLQTGQPLLLRMAFAAGSCHANLTVPESCEFNVVAYDGVPLSQTRQMKDFLYFVPATRIEAAVVCHQEGTFAVRMADDQDIIVFYLSAAGKPSQGPEVATFPLTIPDFGKDYLYMDGASTVQRDVSFSHLDLGNSRPFNVIGQGENCSSLRNSSTCHYEPFMGSRGADQDKYRGFVVPLHSTVTVRVFGDPTSSMAHPLHIHVNHFQVLDFVARAGGQHSTMTLAMYGVQVGDIRDTMPALDGITTIRWKAATYPGEVVYHCHATYHEDRGMMSTYLVLEDTPNASP